jgi:hypothetical protein
VPASTKTAGGTRHRVWMRLSKVCQSLPEVVAGESFGNPCFHAGKRPFVVLDRYRGEDCIFLYVDPGLREELLKDKNFFPAPYDPREKGLCRRLSAIDWTQLKSLLIQSYRQVAIKRMIAALDQKGHSGRRS